MKHFIWFYLQKFCSRLLIVECDECSSGFVCNQQTGDCNEGYTTDIYNSTKVICLPIQLTCHCLMAIYSKRMFVSFKQQSSARSDLYTETGVIPEDSSHYQELGVSEGGTPYQNTSLNH
ncbi:uncharacterized protein LOC111117673 isoform X2 [Crassostrea virginica]